MLVSRKECGSIVVKQGGTADSISIFVPDRNVFSVRDFFMHRVAERKTLPDGNRRPAREQGATSSSLLDLSQRNYSAKKKGDRI